MEAEIGVPEAVQRPVKDESGMHEDEGQRHLHDGGGVGRPAGPRAGAKVRRAREDRAAARGGNLGDNDRRQSGQGREGEREDSGER